MEEFFNNIIVLGVVVLVVVIVVIGVLATRVPALLSFRVSSLLCLFHYPSRCLEIFSAFRALRN